MNMKKQVGIVGLGKFGLEFGKQMIAYGHEVLGVDSDPEKVKSAQRILTQVYELDAMSKSALEQIRIHDIDHVLVSVGDAIAESVMIALYLKELQVQKVYAKAIHRDHEKLLYKIGVDEVIIPEFMAAKQIASRIAIPGFIEFLPFDRSMVVKELFIKRWAGKTLKDLELTRKYSIQIIAVKRKEEDQYRYVPNPDYIFKEGDTIIAIGEIGQLNDMES